MTHDKLNVYDVLLVSLHKSCRRHTTRWVRNIRAESLMKACDFAVARHPNLGLTPTTVSMAWPKFPQCESIKIGKEKDTKELL